MNSSSRFVTNWLSEKWILPTQILNKIIIFWCKENNKVKIEEICVVLCGEKEFKKFRFCFLKFLNKKLYKNILFLDVKKKK